jgi:hypothetical protein
VVVPSCKRNQGNTFPAFFPSVSNVPIVLDGSGNLKMLIPSDPLRPDYPHLMMAVLVVDVKRTTSRIHSVCLMNWE